MKNKDRFASYEQARRTFDDGVVPQYGVTRMEWGFGRWLWLDVPEDRLAYWESMAAAGILTAEGMRKLAREKRKRRTEGAS